MFQKNFIVHLDSYFEKVQRKTKNNGIDTAQQDFNDEIKNPCFEVKKLAWKSLFLFLEIILRFQIQNANTNSKKEMGI